MARTRLISSSRPQAAVGGNTTSRPRPTRRSLGLPVAHTSPRLTDTLARCTSHRPERLADALLAHLDVRSGACDDLALIVLRP
ncbi:hypothetical protein ACWD7F_34965 [Streptomyces sp. NPDC005122]